MDIMSTPPAADNPKDKIWPDVPAQLGVVYKCQDPMHKGVTLAIQTIESWLNWGTMYEAQRRKIEQQDKTVLQLRATNDVLVAQLAALQEKHHNLREATRKERTDRHTKTTPPKAIL